MKEKYFKYEYTTYLLEKGEVVRSYKTEGYFDSHKLFLRKLQMFSANLPMHFRYEETIDNALMNKDRVRVLVPMLKGAWYSEQNFKTNFGDKVYE